MRVLVDTSVWIDYFRDQDNPQTRKLETCYNRGDDLCCCGFVLAEVLQGVTDEMELSQVKRQLDGLIYLPENRATFELGAAIYRELRRKGYTVRNTMDCLISAVVVQHGVSLLENDRDYRHIDRHYPLNRL